MISGMTEGDKNFDGMMGEVDNSSIHAGMKTKC